VGKANGEGKHSEDDVAVAKKRPERKAKKFGG